MLTVLKERNRSERFITGGLLVVFSIAGFVTKLIYSLNRSIDSDDTLPYLYFNDIALAKNYLLKNWYFASDPLFFTDFPFYFLAGLTSGLDLLSLKAIAFSIYLFGILLLAFLLWKRWGIFSALVCLLSLLSISSFATRILTKPYIHAGTIAFSFILLLMIILLIKTHGTGEKKSTRKRFYYFFLFFLSTLAMFSDPFFLFIFTIPLTGAMALSAIFKIKAASLREMAFQLSGLWATAILGVFLHRAAVYLGINFYYGFETSFATPQVFIKNVSLYLQCMMELFGINIFEPNLSLPFVVIKIVKMLFFVCVVMGSLSIFMRETDPLKKFIILFFISQFILISSAYVFSRRPIDLWTARYLTPLVYDFGCFAGLFLGKACQIRKKALSFLVFALLLVTSAHNIYDTDRAGRNIYQMHSDLAKYLESENLSYGFSDYWSSNLITFLTDQRVRTRWLYYANGLLVPYPQLTNFSWYDPSYYKGPTFLMIPKFPGGMGGFELPQLTPERLTRNYGRPGRVLSAWDMNIYVWPYNLMDVGPTASVDISERTFHQIGRIQPSPEGNLLVSKKGETGFLVHGPYWPLGGGKYRVRFMLRMTGDRNSEMAYIDVNVVNRNKLRPTMTQIQKKIVANENRKWQEHTIDFEAEKNNGNIVYEFRLFATGLGDISIQSIILEKIGKNRSMMKNGE